MNLNRWYLYAKFGIAVLLLVILTLFLLGELDASLNVNR